MKDAKDGIAVTFEGEGCRRRAEGADVRPRARLDRPPAELGRARARQDAASRSNQRGFIEVDAARRTAEPSIFAIGDVAGEPMLAHKASHEGARGRRGDRRRARRVRAAGDSRRRLHRSGDRVVRPDRDRGGEAEAARSTVARFPWARVGRAITLDRPDGMTKLVLDPKTERVLGVGIVGPAPAS